MEELKICFLATSKSLKSKVSCDGIWDVSLFYGSFDIRNKQNFTLTFNKEVFNFALLRIITAEGQVSKTAVWSVE